MPEHALFSKGDLGFVLNAQKAALSRAVGEVSEDYLLNVDLDEWVQHLVATYRVDPLVLKTAEKYAEDVGEVQVDVRGYPGRLIRNPSRPAWIPGRAVRVHIPFDGSPDLELLEMKTSTYSNPPIAGVEDNEVVKEYSWPGDAPPLDVDAEVDRLIEVIERFVRWSSEQVDEHNQSLERQARDEIHARSQRVLAAHAHLDSIRIPVRRREDAPTTYAAPGIQRRPPPAPPPAGAESSGAPEPVMIGALYEHTLKLIRSWGKAVERTPKPYRNFDEETLRAALLPMLNSHYEGTATGETFNANGKTDVLIRVEDRAVFIGECKWWGGPGAVEEALDQLFSYTTWRDTKFALIFFVDRKDPMAVVGKVRELLGQHELFIEWEESGDEHELRCRMRWPGDASITAQLQVFFVHLPKPE